MSVEVNSSNVVYNNDYIDTNYSYEYTIVKKIENKVRVSLFTIFSFSNKVCKFEISNILS